MKKLLSPLLCVVAAAALTACASNTTQPAAKAEAKKPAGITATLAPTSADSKAKGNLKFAQTANGVVVSGTVEGLTPGWHAFHVHEKGSCADAGNAAGGHWNPTHKAHGMHGAGEHHVGDMPPLFADAKGVASIDITSQTLALSGANSIIGKAVIVHANDDDYSAQPAGNAGARIACGIITQ